VSAQPPKKDKFKDLMRSPSGSTEVKEELMSQPQGHVNNSATPFVQIIGKKKATFELDAELHHWLKLHAVRVNKKMVDVVEEVLRNYRDDQEKDL
jgi:hypothetical protein